MARWKAEQLERGRGMGGGAASLGSACHQALEDFIKHTHLGGAPQDFTLDTLLMFFRVGYMNIFATSDTDTDEYADGVEMLSKWFARQDFTGVEVLSCEVKENFLVKTSAGEIPLNYIWDRHDKIGDNEYKVVDYKSNRWAIRPEDLRRKPQARIYGLAAQIKYPDAKRIWVEFDMLRHDPVGCSFSRDENIATWKYIKELAERIIATPVDHPQETLNPECRFCIRKQSCGALTKNIAAGGIFGISSAVEAVDKRATLQFQLAAINSAIAELDEVILTEARATDILEFETDMNRAEVTAGSRRTVDPEMVERIVGDDVFKKYGGVSITLTNFEKMIKKESFPSEKISELKRLIYRKPGEPSVKITPKNGLDGD